MYGYVVPDKSCLTKECFGIYRAFYCGICCAVAGRYSTAARMTVGYDLTFLAVLVSDVTKSDVDIVERGCMLDPRRRPMVDDVKLLNDISAVGIILAYRKAMDGIADGEGFKYKVARKLLGKDYKRAVEAMPVVDEIVARSMAELEKLEKSQCRSIDRVADCFAGMMRDIVRVLGCRGEYIERLAYNIGKFVYVMDAVDDAEEDSRKGRYNPYFVRIGMSRKQFLTERREEIEFTLYSTINRIIQDFCRLELTQSYDLLYNIVCYGLRAKVAELLDSNKKLPPPKV